MVQVLDSYIAYETEQYQVRKFGLGFSVFYMENGEIKHQVFQDPSLNVAIAWVENI